MQMPMQITFRNMKPSAPIEDRIRDRAAELEQFCDRIMHCHVVVDAPHRRHRHGKLFHVRIDLTVPGAELVVNREAAAHHAYEDVYVAIRDAFDAAQRQLEDYARRQRGAVKAHEPQPVARVVKLYPEEDHGFLETPDGRQLYFHRHSVLQTAFDRLEIGTEVEFAEEPGEKGPQATTVRPIGKHRTHS